jgi:hypothetical protein
MFLSPGLELDPALLAFVKCHVTSPVKWEVMRMLASHDGAWTSVSQMARRTHRPVAEVTGAVRDLASDGIVEIMAATHDDVNFRLPRDEPTSVVLHRLIEMATHSLELRAIIAAHLMQMRSLQQAQDVRTSTAAA